MFPLKAEQTELYVKARDWLGTAYGDHIFQVIMRYEYAPQYVNLRVITCAGDVKQCDCFNKIGLLYYCHLSYFERLSPIELLSIFG